MGTEHERGERIARLEVRMDTAEDRLDIHGKRIDELRMLFAKLAGVVLLAAATGATAGPKVWGVIGELLR